MAIVNGTPNNENGTFNGGAFRQQLLGTNMADLISTDAGNDIAFSFAGNDALFGDKGNDTLVGGTDNDTLDGGQGNDILNGGPGADILTGGKGADQFYIEGGDNVTDFSNHQGDKLFFLASQFGGVINEGVLDSSQFTVGVAAVNESTQLIYNNQSGGFFFDPDGIGVEAQVQIAILPVGLSLGSSDISIIADDKVPFPEPGETGSVLPPIDPGFDPNSHGTNIFF